jgi:DNA-binding LytR/AlgR family response regulator
MNILIVENETPAADKLIGILRKIDKSVTVLGVCETVEETINRLQQKPQPDLILMDIQLDDGLCFEIFETITVDIPVIFTTAYDKYTLKAFKVNSVDYLLKPVEEESLKAALNKYKKIYTDNDPFRRDFKQLLNEFRNQYRSRFLVRTGEKYRSIPVSDIGYFHIIERSVFLNDSLGKDYGIDYSLEQLQNMIDPRKFFRINRECIVNINAIETIYTYSSSRLQLTLKNGQTKEEFVVSREKVTEFKKWIDR